MGLGSICNLIAHSGCQHEPPAIFELGVQLSLQAQEDVSLRTPMIRDISRRVLDEAHPDAPELLRTPARRPGFASKFRYPEPGPIRDAERDVAYFHGLWR